MNFTTVESISEIIDTFDLIEISELLERQINISDGNILERNTDYFKPLYFRYKSIMENENSLDDIKEETHRKFINVCHIFIKIISKNFGITVDPDWLDDNEGDLPGLVTALYCFFVKDVKANLVEACLNYINKNKADIFNLFEERKNKKDCITIVSKKNYDIKTAVVMANIYDVCTWVLSQMSENQFISYLNHDYSPLLAIENLLENGVIVGEFMDNINYAFTENLSLKADVCFQVLSSISMKKE